MAVDMFLRFEGKIEGESKDKDHKGVIDILAWSWGMQNSGSFHSGGGGGSGKANFQDITFTKHLDKSSPILQFYCVTGKFFEKAELFVRKAGENPLEYLIITMESVIITSYMIGGSVGEEGVTVNFTLNFADVTFSYREQKPDGTGHEPKQFKWNIAANAAK